MKFLLMVCSLAASIVQSADAVEFGHYAASAASLRPDIVPSTAKVWDSGDTAEASYVAWQWPQSNVEHVLRIRDREGDVQHAFLRIVQLQQAGEQQRWAVIIAHGTC